MIYFAFFQLLYLGGRTNRYCTIAITVRTISFCNAVYSQCFRSSP